MSFLLNPRLLTPGTRLLGLHFNGDLRDMSKRRRAASWPDTTWGGDLSSDFEPGAGAFGRSAIRFGGSDNPVRSLDLDLHGEQVLGREWQLSVWLRLNYDGGIGRSGGYVISLGARGSSDGMSIGSGQPNRAQFDARFDGDATTALVTITYPTLVDDEVISNRLSNPVDGTNPTVPVDSDLHHFGIASDENGVRAYWDFALFADSSDASLLRAADQRLMWDGGAYENQYFLVGAGFAGSGDGIYSLGWPWGTSIPVYAVGFVGDMSDLLVRNGPGSATFTGPTIPAITGSWFPDAALDLDTSRLDPSTLNLGGAILSSDWLTAMWAASQNGIRGGKGYAANAVVDRYFEFEYYEALPLDGQFTMGLGTASMNHLYPGYDDQSYGLWGYSGGRIMHEGGWSAYPVVYENGMVIGVRLVNGIVTFYKNGVSLGVAIDLIADGFTSELFYPAAGQASSSGNNRGFTLATGQDGMIRFLPAGSTAWG